LLTLSLSLSTDTSFQTEPNVLVETEAAEAARFVDSNLDEVQKSVDKLDARQPAPQDDPEKRETDTGDITIQSILTELAVVKEQQVEESVRAMTAESLLEQERAVWKAKLASAHETEVHLRIELEGLRSLLREKEDALRQPRHVITDNRVQSIPQIASTGGPEWRPKTPAHDWAAADEYRLNAHTTPRPGEGAEDAYDVSRTVRSPPRRRLEDVVIGNDDPSGTQPFGLQSPQSMEEALVAAVTLAEEFKRRAELAENANAKFGMQMGYEGGIQQENRGVRGQSQSHTPGTLQQQGQNEARGGNFLNKVKEAVNNSPDTRRRNREASAAERRSRSPPRNSYQTLASTVVRGIGKHTKKFEAEFSTTLRNTTASPEETLKHVAGNAEDQEANYRKEMISMVRNSGIDTLQLNLMGFD